MLHHWIQGQTSQVLPLLKMSFLNPQRNYWTAIWSQNVGNTVFLWGQQCCLQNYIYITLAWFLLGLHGRSNFVKWRQLHFLLIFLFYIKITLYCYCSKALPRFTYLVPYGLRYSSRLQTTNLLAFLTQPSAPFRLGN